MPTDIELSNVIENALNPLYLGVDITKGAVDADDWKFNSYMRGNTDLPKITHDKQLKVSAYLSQNNPFAHKFIDLMNAFVIGEGPVPIAANERTQDLIDKFWHCDDNNWPEQSIMFARDLSIYGEQAYFFGQLSPRSPVLGIQYLNPMNIDSVIPRSSNPALMDKLIIKKDVLAGLGDNEEKRTFQLLRAFDIEPFKDPRLAGDAAFFRINHMSDSTRGLSDLFPLADWLQLYGEYQLNIIEKLNHLAMYFFDVEIQDASDDDILKFREKMAINPVSPGAFVVHNDKAKLTPHTVTAGGAGDFLEIAQGLFGIVATGMGWPPHWTGMPDSGGNRSSAEAANDPILRHFLTRQAQLRRYFSRIIQFQIDFAVTHDFLDESVDTKFRFLFPKLGLRDFQRAGSTAARISQALKDTVDAGLLDSKTAQTLMLTAFEHAGIVSDTFRAVPPPTTRKAPIAGNSSEDDDKDEDDKKSDESQRIVLKLLEGVEHAIDESNESRTSLGASTKEKVRSDLYRLITYYLL